MQSLERCFNLKNTNDVKSLLKKIGDFGDVAIEIRT